jgi:hypothetical protein
VKVRSRTCLSVADVARRERVAAVLRDHDGCQQHERRQCANHSNSRGRRRARRRVVVESRCGCKKSALDSIQSRPLASRGRCRRPPRSLTYTSFFSRERSPSSSRTHRNYHAPNKACLAAVSVRLEQASTRRKEAALIFQGRLSMFPFFIKADFSR